MVVFYVVNFKDEERKKRMIDRFRQLDIDLHFVNPVDRNDPRIKDTPLDKRVGAIMLQHLDSIRHFYENTSGEYCVVCEDDIRISRYLLLDLPEIIQDFEELELDVLLLGYLFPHKPYGNHHFPVYKKTEKYSYHGFPSDIWGSQMYLLSRKSAGELLQIFTVEHALSGEVTFSPDWTITKYGKRAVIAPMLAVEEGKSKSGLGHESDYHQRCYQCHFDPDVHI